MSNSYYKKQRGFTLLVALIFVSVILSVGLALLDVSYKQQILTSAARQSQYAFYNADSAMECALEQDQINDTFDYVTEPVGTVSNAFYCEGVQISYTASPVVGSSRTTTFVIPCAGGGANASTTIYKKSSGAVTTSFYVNGYNNCQLTDPLRLGRGLQSKY